MKSLQLRLSTLAVFLLCLYSAQAESYSIDGFSYEFNDHEATVTGCSLSGDIVIPETVTHNNVTYTVTTIGGLAFYCDHKVTSIRMPNTITTIKNNAFIYANELKTVYFPSSIEVIEGFVFYDNASLTTLFCLVPSPPYPIDGTAGPIEETVTLYVPSESLDAYKSAPYWKNFKNIIPIDVWDFVEDEIYYHIVDENNVSVTFKELGFGTYSGHVVIPETVTHNGITYHVTGISASAFAYSSNLTNVAIPVTVTSVGNDAFFGCSLQSLIITGNGAWTAGALNLSVNELFIGSGVTSMAGMRIEASDIYSSAFNPPTCDDFTFTSYNAALHVPPTSFSSYFTAPYWKYFINISGDADFTWPTAVELDQTNALLEIGEELLLGATVQPAETSYSNINWVSSNPSVASVQDGVVTALSSGDCVITASCLTATATCHIAVIEKKVHISLDSHSVRIKPNHMVILTPTLTPITTNIAVTSSDPGVAVARIANGKIQVVGISEGATRITVNSVDGYAVPDSCEVTVYTDRGDLDCNGYVTIADVTSLIDYLLTRDETAINLANADTNKDGNINISDVTTLIDYLLIGSWPWEMNRIYSVNGIEFTMVPVEGGTFTMGATGEQGNDAYDTERPTHEVTLSDFLIGQTEVTEEL